MRIDHASFWWDYVTGPVGFIGEVVDRLCEPSCVALRLPQDAPWRHSMRESIIESIRTKVETKDLTITRLDAGSITEPGQALLCLALKQVREDYMPWAVGIVDYLRDNDVLTGRLVWVYNIPDGMLSEWCQFCKSWNPQRASQGILLLETSCFPPNGISCVSYDSYVSESSVRVFCSTLLDDGAFRSLTEERRAYTVSLLVRLCHGDVELATELAKTYRPMNEEPLEALSRVLESGCLDDRIRLSKDHPLSLLHDKNYDRLNASIWSSQVECLFPIIEQDRIEIVEKHRTRLSEIVRSGILNTNQDTIEHYRDIEVGQLYWLMHRSTLKIEDPGEHDHIELLRECRNLIAHRTRVPEEKVRLLIDKQGWRPDNRKY